jgi:hypothetical protein
VDNRADIRDFLASRRAKISPEQSGPPSYGGNRRVPGLRREEVALLTGVSVDYYTRLERENLNGVSDGVLDAVARRRPSPQRVRPSVSISTTGRKRRPAATWV